MPANKFVKDLASALFDAYVDDNTIAKEVGDLLLSKDKLGEALAEMLDRHILDLGDTNVVTDSIVQKAIEKLREVQDKTGILKADGILGERTFHWLFTRLFGHDDTPHTSLPKSKTTAAPSDTIHALRYFIEGDRLPHVPSMTEIQTLIAFTEAWESWALVCKINVKQTGNRADANVIVRVAPLDSEPKSVVALAHIGPPRDRQLSLTFDSGESFTPHMLRATAAHEIGHLLGLRHIGAPNQLMNDTLHDNIATPQSEDIKAAVAIWGPR